MSRPVRDAVAHDLRIRVDAFAHAHAAQRVLQGEHEADLCLPLAGANDGDACGGKAASLARLLRAGIAVPQGFVLTVRALELFLTASGLRPRLAAIERACDGSPEARQALQAQVRELFDAAALPPALHALLAQHANALPGTVPLIVRSSACGEDGVQSSYAGLLDSVLGVDRRDGLAAAIKRVWASRWSARAGAYAAQRGAALGGVGVIVQVQAEAAHAGVLFTRSPEPGRGAEMLCEYCAGLAERLVAGEITPRRLAIERASLALRAAGGGRADEAGAALPPAHAEALARTALAAERVFGQALDIEWVIDRGQRVWLVQARPITTRTLRRIVWSNANVNENFPAPISPLLYSVASAGYSHYFRNLGCAFGLSRRRLRRMSAEFAAIIGVHGARMYYNLSAIHAVLRAAPFGERLVAWFDDFTGASHPQAATETGAHRGLRGLRDACELAWIGLKTTWQYLFFERRVRAFEARIDAFAHASAPATLERLAPLALRDLLRDFLDIRLHRWTDAGLADAAAMATYGVLKALVTGVLGEGEVRQAHNDLLKGLSGVASAEPVNALWALADRVRSDARLGALFRETSAARIADRLATEPDFGEFHAAFRDYLERWGFRCSGELMLTVESFQERPQDLLEIVRAYAAMDAASPQARLAAQRVQREAVTARVLARARDQRLIAWLPGPSRIWLLRPVLAATQAAIGLRERARLKQALLYSRLRRIALALGERLVAQGTLGVREDVFFLTVQELDALVSGLAMYPQQTRPLVALRRAAHARFEALTPPDVLIAAEGEYPDPARCAPPAPAEGGAAWVGAGVCGGVHAGRARVLAEVGETRTLARGDVLVTRQTDPGWAPAFAVIGALVLERGGMLSHGAILAREYGIPTVVGIAGATQRIASGMHVEVDGDQGVVRRIP